MKNSQLPRSSREAFAILDKMLTHDEINAILHEPDAIDLHLGLGLWIRNNWIYPNQEKIMVAFGLYKEGDLSIYFDADYLSDLIIQRYIQHLKRKK